MEYAMTYRGHIKNGTVILDDPVDLLEGAAVEIVVFDVATAVEPPRRTLRELLAPFIGMADDLPPDGSCQLDHYLYGTPKE
jgi:hypothetical protein